MQKAQEAEMEQFIEDMEAPRESFKSRKEIRKMKYGIDEDEDEILNQKIRIPRKMDHEKLPPLEELTSRHKVRRILTY